MSQPPSKLYPLRHQILSLLQTTKATSQILQIHSQLITSNLISDTFLASKLLKLTLSSKPPNMNYSNLIFLQIQEPSTFVCNIIVNAYITSSNPQKAFSIYIEMRKKGIFGDSYTYPFVLKGCGIMDGVWEGRQVHGEAVKSGYERDLFVGNGLIGMYCKCGKMVEAQNVFDEMPEKDVVSWSIMIDGYGKKIGDVVRARELFDKMPVRDMVPWNSMIDSYSKVGDMTSARQLFDSMEERNVISWSIVIDGYARCGSPKEALNLFRQMLYLGLKPDNISVVGALTACSLLGALDQGRWIHTYMQKNQIALDIVVETVLVDMYMKCGSVSEACAVFNNMPQRNLITWNVMIAGLGINGLGKDAVKYFTWMEMDKIQFDNLIFVSVLTACSHAGFVTEGLEIFHKMRIHGVEPKLEHYGCLIDLLGRAGQLEKAALVIESMSMTPNPDLLGSLLLACKTHKNVGLAEAIVERLVELEADDRGVYALMSNIYADAGMWEGAWRIRELMRERNMNKEGGKSVIEVNGGVEEFTSGRKANIQIMDIEAVLSSLLNLVAHAE